MDIIDPINTELTDRSREAEDVRQVLMVCPDADSCLPLPTGVIRRKGGIILRELEDIIREQLETGGHSVRTLNDGNEKRCAPSQGSRRISLLKIK